MPRAPWLLLAYPPGVHLCIVLERPEWAVAALVVGAAGAALWLVWRRRPGGALAALGVAAGLAGVGVAGGAQELLYLPPITFSLFFLLLFGATLLPGREPLITVLARAMGEPDSPAMARYTRRVTEAWTAFFAGLLALGIGLALWASPVVWSLFMNFGSYLLVAAFFLVEFRLRGRLLPGHRYARLRDFLGALPAFWRDRAGGRKGTP